MQLTENTALFLDVPATKQDLLLSNGELLDERGIHVADYRS